MVHDIMKNKSSAFVYLCASKELVLKELWTFIQSLVSKIMVHYYSEQYRPSMFTLGSILEREKAPKHFPPFLFLD